MASTAKTANYRLNQWAGDDKPVRADFNADNQLIDNALVAIRESATKFTPLGLYATLGALEAAHPTGEAGQAYVVGTALENELYIWDTVTGAWVSIGPVQGAVGDVVGPESATDGKMATYDGDTGKLLGVSSYSDTDIADAISRIEEAEGAIGAIDARASTLESQNNTGWNAAPTAWTYESIDDPTGGVYISGNATTYLSVRMRIKLTNGGNTIYGIITAVGAYDSGNNRTQVTFLHEIDPTDSQALYLLANSAITNAHYSMMDIPFGFPADPRKWTVKVTSSTNQAVSSPYTSYKRAGTVGLTVPIGAWKIWGKFEAQLVANSVVDLFIYVSISTSSSAETYPELTRVIFLSTTVTDKNLISNYTAEAQLALAAKTEFFPIMKSPTSSITVCQINAAVSQMIILATCAYL